MVDEVILTASRDIRLSEDGGAMVLRLWPGVAPSVTRRPFGRDQLLSWLEKGLPRTESCVDRLFKSIEIMRATVHVSEALPWDPLAEAYSAMQVLKTRLPMLADVGRKNDRHHLADAFSDLYTAVVRAESLIDRPVRRPHKAVAWHDDAAWLLCILRTEAAPLPIKISAAGPGVRFLQKSLRCVWNLDLKGDQIKNAVARYSHGLDLKIEGQLGQSGQMN